MSHKLTVVKGADIHEVGAQLQRQIRDSALDPNVVKLAVIASSSNPDPIQGIHGFVKRTFPYNDDPKIIQDRYGLDLPGEFELFTAPWIMAREYVQNKVILEEDCDGLNSLIAALNKAMGYDVRVLLVDVDQDGEIDHLLCEVGHPIHRRWLTVDVTTDFPLYWAETYGRSIVIEI